MKYLILLAVLSAGPATASTSEAWAASTKAAQAACIAAANLRSPAVSTPIHFSDRTGSDALLVSGVYPQKSMKGARGTMLCLYDRRSHRAEAAEMKGWTAR